MKRNEPDEQKLTSTDRLNRRLAIKQTVQLSNFSLRKRVTLLKNEWWYWNNDNDVIQLDSNDDSSSLADEQQVVRHVSTNGHDRVDRRSRSNQRPVVRSLGRHHLFVRRTSSKARATIDVCQPSAGRLLSFVDVRRRTNDYRRNDLIVRPFVSRLSSSSRERILVQHAQTPFNDIDVVRLLVLSVRFPAQRTSCTLLSALDQRHENVSCRIGSLAVDASFSYQLVDRSLRTFAEHMATTMIVALESSVLQIVSSV
jgi:hypothetical protein